MTLGHLAKGAAIRNQKILKEMIWHGQVMWGIMVCESPRAIDYLSTRNDVGVEELAP